MVPIAEELVSNLALQQVLVVEHRAFLVVIGRVAKTRGPANSGVFLLFRLLRIDNVRIVAAGRWESSLFGGFGQIVASGLTVVLITHESGSDMFTMRPSNCFVSLLHQTCFLFSAGIGIKAEGGCTSGSRLT